MAYAIRETVSKSWPIPRKGTKYVIVPSHNKKTGIPLLILMRDVLKFVKTRKELKTILHEKKVLVNNKPEKEENRTLVLFDTLKLEAMKKAYKVSISPNKKIILEEIPEKDVNQKICKVIDKKILKGKKTQINLNDSRNILSEEKIKTGDSVLIDLDKKKIEKILPVKENADVLVIKGKHMGKKGKITKVDDEVSVKTEDSEIKIVEEELIVLN